MATARIPQPTAEDPVKVDPRHYKVEFENERVRVLRIKYGPGEKSIMHSHPESIAVFLTDAHHKFSYPDGRTQDIKADAGTPTG
jgi:quercetin dioxygenase-like cupin family protein